MKLPEMAKSIEADVLVSEAIRTVPESRQVRASFESRNPFEPLREEEVLLPELPINSPPVSEVSPSWCRRG